MDPRSEILRCKKDFEYFARRYLKIVTKDAKLKPFNMNSAQREIISSFAENPHLMLLKARQLGSTTGIAAYFFWDALFTPHMSIAVVAHTDEAVKRIFEIYRRFYKNLPEFLKLETVRSRENELKFITGSGIKVGSASTQSFRGGTYQRIHASEYAFWGNMQVAIASLFGTATDDALIVLESTANGMNEAYDMWSQENGFLKTFMSWKMDKNYVLEKPHFDDPSEEELEYSYKHKLSEKQFNWLVRTLRTKCGNNWNIFNQEYPAKPEMAFITTGSRFFPTAYGVNHYKEGYQEFEPPRKMGIYIMGVDTASGSPGGDYSSFMIIDATRRDSKDMRTVASYYERIPPSLFSKIVYEKARRYKALVVIESNSYGLSIVEAVRNRGYPNLYRNTSFDKITNRWVNKIGFTTTSQSRPLLINRLYENVTRGWLEIKCDRFKCEANRLQYNTRGKVEAMPGYHDDMIIATGLSLMGLDQINDLEEEILKQYKPSSISDMLSWEMATGKRWKDHDPNEFASDSGETIEAILGEAL